MSQQGILPASRVHYNRTAQVSPYLILAVLLIIAVSLLFYTGQLQRLFGPLRVAYPVEVEPVARHIQDCAVKAGTEAVLALASQGGYIMIPDEISREYDSFLGLDDLGMRVIPFWMHRGRSRIPTIPFMERQVSDYAVNRTRACIDSFKALGDQFSITEEGNLSVTTTLTKDTVYLSITYPLKVIPKATLKETRLQEFTATIPARLKRLYELALLVMKYQNQKLAIENLTIDLMSADPSVPMNHLGVECKHQTWNIQDIRTRVQELVAANLLTIRIKNTDHIPFEAPESVYEALAQAGQAIQQQLLEGTEDFGAIKTPASPPSDSFEYFHTYWDVGAQETPLRVAFAYQPEFGMDLSASPSTDGRLYSTVYRASKRFLPFLCLHAYHFTYTLTYPVLVMVEDPASFGGKGLTFEFAFPVMISNNAPAPERTSKRSIAEVRPAAGFCAKVGNRYYEIRAIGKDEEGYTSNTGLDEANISYRCAGRLCPLGTTQAEAGAYALVTPLPSGCKNPALIAEKQGYLPGESFLTEPTTLVPLTRIKTLDLSVKKQPYFGIDKKLGELQGLAEDENVTISLTALGKDFQHSASFPGENAALPVLEEKTDYRIDAVLTKGDRIIGGFMAPNITITGRQASQASDIELTVIEYRPTPISDAEEAAMALYLTTHHDGGITLT